MPESYLLVINGKPEGPFTIEQLRGKGIKPGDFVKTGSMDDYKEAHEIAELRQLFGFRKPPHIPQYFGSFDQRLLASALDWFFVAGACILAAFILTLFTTDRATRLFIAFGLLAVIPAAKMIYHIAMESSAKQATYGKRILGIKVCDMEGNRINIGHALGRNFAKIFSVLTFFVGYLLCFFNKQQQCLHDMIAGTLVMKDRLF
ncbi:MAG: RDD family protein [Bacteroidota bacterium]|nr:RDD family protein [Bacteroidota bacterium]